DSRESLLEKFELFAGEIWRDVGQSRDISSRARQAVDDPLGYRVRGCSHDDRDRVCGLLCGQRCGAGRCDDDVQFETNHFVGEAWKSISTVLPVPAFNHDILALDPSVVAKPLQKYFFPRRCRRRFFIAEIPDPSNFYCWLLRLDGDT